MKATQIVTIKSFSPMFKNGEEASNIHIVNVEEHDFDIVAQKSLYQIGDKALFIQPDYCLSDIELFQDFIAPNGDKKKSKLGSNNRIKSIKFGFVNSKGNKVYSDGILIPLIELKRYLKEKLLEINVFDLNLDEILGITKYEEPEGKLVGETRGNLPSGMYKTDEVNFKNISRNLESLLPCELIGTIKIDGSSCTVYYKNEVDYGICSRLLEKKLFLEGELQKDDWVQLGYPLLQKLISYNKSLALRCEIYGEKLKGSGNKYNPHAKLPKSIKVYGIDDYSSGVCIPLPMEEVIKICKELDLPIVDIVFIDNFNSIDEVKDKCENYFKDNLIEGIVIRTYKDTSFTSKYMNNEYDSKK